MVRQILDILGYAYSDQLRALEEGSHNTHVSLPQEACTIITPLKLESWRELLGGHPDAWYREFIVRGIREGFRIGYHGNQLKLRSRLHNMKSVDEHPIVVDNFLDDKGIARVGSPQTAKEMGVHCSPFGVIPMRNRVNKFQLIMDLSAPEGGSVNNAVEKELVTLSYNSVDEVVTEVLRRGQGTQLDKMDVKQACHHYRDELLYHDVLLFR